MAIKKGRKTRKNKSMLGGIGQGGYYTFEDRRDLIRGTQFIREVNNCPEGYMNCNDKCIVKKFKKNHENERYYLTYAKASNPEDLRYAVITMAPDDQDHVLLGFPLETEFGEPDRNNYLIFSMKVPPREDPLELDGKFILFDLKPDFIEDIKSYLVYAEKEKFDAQIRPFPHIIFRGFHLYDNNMKYPLTPEYYNEMFQITDKGLVEIKNKYKDLVLSYDETRTFDLKKSFIRAAGDKYFFTNIRILNKDDIRREFFENLETEYNTFILELENTQTRSKGGKRNARQKKSKKKKKTKFKKIQK